MAEYINRKDLDFLNDFRIDSGKYAGLRLDDVFNGLATADMIERSEYEKIKFQRDISMQQIHDLGNSVSKAIEEMEKFKEDVASTKDLYAQSCVGYCIEILKRNM